MALSLQNIRKNGQLLLTDRRYFWSLASLVILVDAAFSQLILLLVPYTEIDWETYMVQIKAYINGERDYAKISGPTGPLVYPAGHVHIHRALYEFTDSGTNIFLAQRFYAALYLASLYLTCSVYDLARMPNWITLLLPLSKRLHSIFMLRLFNDCWALVLVQASIFAFQEEMDDFGAVLFSAALSVKMSILLYLPGLLVILFLRHGPRYMFRKLFTMAAVQTVLAYRFIHHDYTTYLDTAFNFDREFLYKWTVNWRMIPEEIFSSPEWSKGLLLGHVFVLVAFGWFQWCKQHGGVLVVLRRGLSRPGGPTATDPLSADYVATVLFTSNLIGIIFARSLHYQFYSWYAQQVPFLAWRTGFPIPIKLAILVAIEYSWNVFPATPQSSSILLAANCLLLVGVWSGYPRGIYSRRAAAQKVS